ncbi:MAG: TraG family conjugative transposon ATPase [Bacteroidota bacterium]
MKTLNLSDRIPIWKIENHLVLSKTQALSATLELTMPEAYSLSEGGLEKIYNMFDRIIKAMPKGYLLHKQDYYVQKVYERNGQGTTFLSSAYERKFNERSFLEHRCYLVLTKNPLEDAFTTNILTTLISGRLVKRDISDGITEFENTIRKVQHIISAAGIDNTLMVGKEIVQLLNEYYNLGSRQILKDIAFEKDHIRIGDNEVVIYNTIAANIEIPTEIDSTVNVDEFFDRSVTYPIGIGLAYPHIVNTVIRKNDPNKLIKTLSRKREKILSMTFKSRENEQLVTEYDNFLSAQIDSGSLPVYVSQNVMLWGKGESLVKAENQLNNALTKMEVFVQRNFNCANVFWACTPGNAADLPESEYQIQFSDTASLFFPVETNPKNSGIEGVKFSERDYGIPITVDIWDTPMKKGWITNRNMFVLGPSGSGKSFFVNFMVRQLLEQQYHITIIDVGGSYRRLCSYMGGKYYEYTAKSKMAFNPFYVPAGEVKNLEEQESLKTLIFTLWKGESGSISKEEYTILSKCIIAYYEFVNKEGLASNFNSFYEFVTGAFTTMILEEEKDYFDFTSFKMVLKPYYRGGEYDYLLNSPEEFSIADLPFCVFELDEIKDHPVIFPIVALVIMDAFIAKMRKYKAVKKIILIEEAWSAISNAGMAEFLKYLYKTVRKFNGSVGIITQELEDIIGNPFVKNTILNNADIQILLDQTKYQTRFEDLAKLLGLPESETKKVMSINKVPLAGERSKDVYIRLGQVGKVYSVLVPPEEVAMYTTEAADSVMIDEFTDKSGDLEYGIIKYLDKKN